jgi:hypothetical protein
MNIIKKKQNYRNNDLEYPHWLLGDLTFQPENMMHGSHRKMSIGGLQTLSFAINRLITSEEIDQSF